MLTFSVDNTRISPWYLAARTLRSVARILRTAIALVSRLALRCEVAGATWHVAPAAAPRIPVAARVLRPVFAPLFGARLTLAR